MEHYGKIVYSKWHVLAIASLDNTFIVLKMTFSDTYLVNITFRAPCVSVATIATLYQKLLL